MGFRLGWGNFIYPTDHISVEHSKKVLLKVKEDSSLRKEFTTREKCRWVKLTERGKLPTT
jgi:hypothetical protein